MSSKNSCWALPLYIQNVRLFPSPHWAWGWSAVDRELRSKGRLVKSPRPILFKMLGSLRLLLKLWGCSAVDRDSSRSKRSPTWPVDQLYCHNNYTYIITRWTPDSWHEVILGGLPSGTPWLGWIGKTFGIPTRPKEWHAELLMTATQRRDAQMSHVKADISGPWLCSRHKSLFRSSGFAWHGLNWLKRSWRHLEKFSLRETTRIL